MASAPVVVVGAGIGGLSAAIHARLAGWDVTVLEQGAVGGKAARIQTEGYTLDPGPSIIILPRIYRDLFSRAGRRMEDYLTFERLDPISRVLFGDRPPLDLPADRKACEAVVDQISKHDGANFRRLMSKLDGVVGHIDKSIFRKPYLEGWELADPHLIATALRFDVRKSYKELVDGWFESDLLRAFFYGFPSYGGQTYDSKAAGALLIPYLMVQEGVYYPVGGVAAIPEALEKLARELGVEFRAGARVVGLEREPTKVGGVRLEGGEVVPSSAILCNVDPLTAGKWLGRTSNLEPSYSYFTLHWGIRKRLEGLKHHTLLIPEGYLTGLKTLYGEERFPEPPIVYLNATSEQDPSVAPPGCTNLFAVVTSPARNGKVDWDSGLPALKASVRNVMRSYGVDFADDEIAFERVQSPPYFEAAHGNYLGSLYGAHERHRHLGILPSRNDDPEVKNLFYCGGGVQPGAGLPMATLSGKFAADLLSRRLKR